MKTFVMMLLATMFGGTAVGAELPPKCAVAKELISAEFALPRVAKAIENKKLDVLVVGAGSSTLAGAEAKAYPARLQLALTENLPGVDVKVHADIKPGRTAVDAVKPVQAGVAANKPALLVWQAGTVDAMKGLDLDDFSSALDGGIEAAHRANSDVVLLNGQYSPRTESIISLGHYSEHMRWVGLRNDTPLFDRYGIMKLWADTGTFDFMTHTKKLDMAEQVHDCIGRLLADLVIKSAKEAAPNGAR
ncbi:MAG TPA: SGNH/GDSL hydrolase family protein [Pseudolabrys sp.]|jgi:hypothetical protein|nr:SGNH/GDSL hydrolase family protein [Pseudolabrys sp.]